MGPSRTSWENSRKGVGKEDREGKGRDRREGNLDTAVKSGGFSTEFSS